MSFFKCLSVLCHSKLCWKSHPRYQQLAINSKLKGVSSLESRTVIPQTSGWTEHGLGHQVNEDMHQVSVGTVGLLGAWCGFGKTEMPGAWEVQVLGRGRAHTRLNQGDSPLNLLLPSSSPGRRVSGNSRCNCPSCVKPLGMTPSLLIFMVFNFMQCVSNGSRCV